MPIITTDTTLNPNELIEYLNACDATRIDEYEDVRALIMATRFDLNVPNHSATGIIASTERMRWILRDYITTLDQGTLIPEYGTEITTWEYCSECNVIMCNCMGYGPF